MKSYKTMRQGFNSPRLHHIKGQTLIKQKSPQVGGFCFRINRKSPCVKGFSKIHRFLFWHRGTWKTRQK